MPCANGNGPGSFASRFVKIQCRRSPSDPAWHYRADDWDGLFIMLDDKAYGKGLKRTWSALTDRLEACPTPAGAERNDAGPWPLACRLAGDCVSRVLRVQPLTRSAPPGKLAESNGG